MKKRLLTAFAVILAAASGFAHEVDSYVYTPQGRFQITGENTCTFAELENWTVIAPEAAEGQEPLTLSDVFSYVGADDAAPAGYVSTYAENTYGMSYKFSPDANAKYVVSITVNAGENTPNFNTRTVERGITSSCQIMSILGTDADGATVEFGKPLEILPGTNTLSWAIVGDGTPRDYVIKLVGWNSSLRICDIQIQEAMQVGDLRQLTGLVEYAQALLAIEGVDKSSEQYESLEGILADLEEFGDESTVGEVEGMIEGINETINEYVKIVDDFLTGSADDKLPLGSKKAEKLGKIGCWSGYGGGSGRLCTYEKALNEAGHYQQANSWGNGNGCIGFYTQMKLQPGSYVFSIDTRASCRENVKNSWDFNDGLAFAKELIYCAAVPAEGEVNTDEALASISFIANPADVQKNTIVVNIPEAGTYEFGVRTWAKDGYEGLKYGSCVLMKDARIYGKAKGAQYTQAQLNYVEDVVGQISAARASLDEAVAGVADESKPWSKSVLIEAIAEYTPVLAVYEAMDTATILLTFDETIYDHTKGLEDKTQDEDLYRLLASEVYTSCAKGLIAAVRTFNDNNKPLASLADAIQAAKDVEGERIYTNAAGRADLDAAIAAAEGIEAVLWLDDYSEENVTTINETIAALKEAVSAFQASIPEEYQSTIVDMAANLVAAQNAETGRWEIKVEGDETGAKGIASTDSFSEDPNGNTSFGIGYVSNETNLFPSLVRVGNGDAIVELPAIDPTSIVQFTFDYYYGNLITKYASFNIDAKVTPEATEENPEPVAEYPLIASENVDKYDSKADPNTFSIDVNNELTGVGSSSASNDAIAAESNKSSYTVNIDIAAKSMTCIINSPKGTFTHTAEMAESQVPARFRFGSNYNNADRRCFFGNLVVKTINAGEYDGISEVSATKRVNNGKIYTISGVEVKNLVKGINIINGKKIIK